MTTRGKFKLARQLADKGAFAEVHLEIEAAPVSSISFGDCDCTECLPDGDPVYSAAVTFGIRFALEKLIFLGGYPRNFAVRVSKIYTMSVDSTEGFVAYAASAAVFAALGRSDTPMELNMQIRAVILSYDQSA